ncbi:serine hydrolase domain-containing protein [Flagellimonas nanhaiensis]|nr:serine hydrolase domain-containing protein [Allomuricauda nanhaiensis]
MAKADELFQDLIFTKQIPGLAVTIYRKNEKIFQKGYGYADLKEKTSVDPKKTVFRTASISKCITGLALGKMLEAGILDLEDSFYSHVPYFPQKEHDFTLKQLAGHTAGIRGYRGKEFALNKPYSIKESLTVFQDDPLVFEPGKGYLYNSFDFVLLSLAMQEASGIPFEEYVNNKVLKPLGMNHTIAPQNVGESPLAYNMAQFYTIRAKSFSKAVEVNNTYKLSGGGFLSTSEDIARMGNAILEGKLLKKETYDQLLSSQEVNGTLTYYGMGFQVSIDNEGRSFIGHVGNSVGAYTNFFVYPKEELSIAILINCSNPKVQNELDSVIQQLWADST